MISRPLHAVQFPPQAGERMLAALRAALDGSGPAILPLDPALPAPALAAAIEAFGPDALVTTEGTRVLSAGRDAGRAARREDTAVVVATSGSTGRPKAVELTAAAMTASAAASLRRIGARPGDRWLCCLPLFHVSGLGVLVRSLVSATEPVFAPSATPAAVAGSGCAQVSLVPTQLRRLLDAGAGPGPVRTVLLGGAASGGELLSQARAAGWRVVTTYGMSETCGGCVYDGMALDGVQVRLAAGGRIELGGPTVFSGYLGEPGLTTRVLSGGWFATADLGSWGPDGSLVVRGRLDDVINTGGEKVVPGEVEAVLGTAPGVADVVVVGITDRQWGEAVTAFVVPAKAGEPLAADKLAEQLKAHVRATLPAYAAPRNVVFVREVPLLPSGKPDRAALRGGLQAGATKPDGNI